MENVSASNSLNEIVGQTSCDRMGSTASRSGSKASSSSRYDSTGISGMCTMHSSASRTASRWVRNACHRASPGGAGTGFRRIRGAPDGQGRAGRFGASLAEQPRCVSQPVAPYPGQSHGSASFVSMMREFRSGHRCRIGRSTMWSSSFDFFGFSVEARSHSYQPVAMASSRKFAGNGGTMRYRPPQ